MIHDLGHQLSGFTCSPQRGRRFYIIDIQRTLFEFVARKHDRIPDMVLDVWRAVAGYPADPEACLVNFYSGDARMGMHRDADEEDLAAPVVSISLGDTAIFRLGGLERGGRTQSFKLASGDVLVMGGASRLRYHGIDRVLAGSSTLLDGGGRINLTLRRVTGIAA